MFSSDFTSLISQLIAQFTDAHVDLGDTKSCIVRMESGIEIHLETLTEDQSLFIFCFLGELPDRRDIIALLVRLLQDNLPPHDIGIFGLDNTAQKLTLSYVCPFEEMTLEDLVQHVHHFQEKALSWKMVISGQSTIPSLHKSYTSPFSL